jgi:hypothetical protein
MSLRGERVRAIHVMVTIDTTHRFVNPIIRKTVDETDEKFIERVGKEMLVLLKQIE